ncbi:restriction endonuclease subunit S [Bifidobacterium breve]|uniref:restriction endonuclease subunit S n=1 Tax=Bifidobacterium breve TaxID=1685 RepID=UPI00232EC19E|nr:restriction endonuclease subunit S [Bifidobacterium breve]MDB1196848.1 restriction endonuclease subunit S [Bifidobacterium breve]
MTRLGDVCEKIGSGATPRGGKEAYKDAGIPIIRSQNIHDWVFQPDGLAFLDDEQAESLSNVEVRSNDVLLNITGDSVARACIVPSERIPARVNQHVAIVRAGKEINPTYLLASLQSKKTMLLSIASSGATRNALTKRMIENLDIDLPSREIQDSIAQVLDSIQYKITLNNRLNDYLEQLVDGKFQELFGGLNFNATLSDVAEITMGQSPAGSSYNEEGAGIIFYQGRGEFGWRFPKRRLYTTEPKRLACEGDVLMSVRAPVGDLNVAFENCCIGRGLAAIHSETPSFALYLMRFLKPQLEAYNGEGTVFGSINGKALKSLEVALPSHNEVMQFESFAAPIDALIRSNENETRKLNNLRNYLLPKLMSGEIDVSKVDLTQLTNNHLADC